VSVQHIAARTGIALRLDQGATLRISDPEGEQVADLFAFARDSTDEWLCNGRSFDYNGSLRLTSGHVLYSNASRPMLTILRDDVGRHDFLFAACSQEMFRLQYDVHEQHPNCLANLSAALAPHGVSAAMLRTPFNVFMNTSVAADGSITIGAPLSKPGDSIVLRAEMDLDVAVSACSAATCNNGRCTGIDVEVS
jgi:uncharacterized protein YcgI (DUF1989 family)